jgi:hypothetical protein
MHLLRCLSVSGKNASERAGMAVAWIGDIRGLITHNDMDSPILRQAKSNSVRPKWRLAFHCRPYCSPSTLRLRTAVSDQEGLQGALNGYGSSSDEQASTIVVDYH